MNIIEIDENTKIGFGGDLAEAISDPIIELIKEANEEAALDGFDLKDFIQTIKLLKENDEVLFKVSYEYGYGFCVNELVEKDG